MNTTLATYLRPHRRRWALTQDELGDLLGYETGATISALERNIREPSLRAAHGLAIIFGVSPAEIFPHLHRTTQNEVGTRARDLYERLQGDSSQAIRIKLNFLESVLERTDPRKNTAA